MSLPYDGRRPEPPYPTPTDHDELQAALAAATARADLAEQRADVLEAALADAAALREALERIARQDTPIVGLAPHLYGHAVTIAHVALSGNAGRAYAERAKAANEVAARAQAWFDSGMGTPEMEAMHEALDAWGEDETKGGGE